MRKLTKSAARHMAAARKSYGGGRPKKPTNCRKCGRLCPSESLARVHCQA